jgi:hypothetical protein
MESTLASGSKSARRAASISEVSMPAYLAAGTKTISPSLTVTTTGSAAWPVMMMAS